MSILVMMLMSMVLVSASLQMVVSMQPTQAKAIRERSSARAVALSALPVARDYLETQINNGTTYSQGNQITNQYVTAPTDPTNLGGSTGNVGSYTITVAKKNGDYYLLQIAATVGKAQDTETKLYKIPYSCEIGGAAVESAVLAGNIASVSDAALIAYAQHNCMLKPAPDVVTYNTVASLYPVTAGTGGACSSGTVTNSGSGTLNIGGVSGSCGENVGGTYTLSKFATVNSSATLQVNTPQPTELDVDILQSTLDAYNFTGAAETSNPLNLRLNSVGGNGYINGSNGDDVVAVTGNLAGGVNLGDGKDTVMNLGLGNDTVLLGGDYVDNNGLRNTELYLGDGTNTAYVKRVPHGGTPQQSVRGGTGTDKVYFNEYWIYNIVTYDGDDVVSCTGLFGTPSCTGFGDWMFLRTGNGNDIISLDNVLTQSNTSGGYTEVNGEAGNNIIYLKGINNTSTTYNVLINPTTTGNSLLILGGNRSSSTAATIAPTGSNNVLMLKSGTTSSGITYSNFARTITY